MKLTVGTFNLNNHFSRWNFAAEIDALPPRAESETAYIFGAHDAVKLRTERAPPAAGGDGRPYRQDADGPG